MQEDGESFAILSPIWPLECSRKGQKIVVSYWMCDSIKFFIKNYLHVKFAAFVGYYKRDGQFLILLDSHVTPRVPQKGSKILICYKWGTVWNLWWEIIFLHKFAASGGLLLEKWAIFDPFWPLRCPPKWSKLMICPKWVTA